ncbi:hypothetical protein ANOM_005142 [Aspergillus nomiae NRRL 13137]|uniref:Amine oxidase, flavin-containing superfamily n=1 Tax=Aspergillus nomiae NRRL (strain ATCC 15546 / NRRL 13137 / CBS 260.88 / M93) TaxID=1509407 RepID=A0A0L1J114_ASPN3|nr:uncharacterized protein ANOM_005142 [Aspergillus nomiae NRRL 13137]KNG85486.1 hypothetical protein ANOM_005142 [Aspergillus nomiae NRRL 13137]
MHLIFQAFASIVAMCLIGTMADVTQSDSKHEPFSLDQLGILERDVAVIGGGSAGTYAAIRLRQLGQRLVVIEKQDRLGGHSNTYFDTASGTAVPYGVRSFHHKSVVTDYFSHFNISLVNKIYLTNQSENVDFTTGEPITLKPITIPSDDPEIRIAMENYKAQLAKYPFLKDEYYNLPDPIPEDLLLPFGEFAAKFKIDAIVRFIAGYTAGFGDHLLKPTLYILRMFSLDFIYELQHGLLDYPMNDNSVLYRAAEKELGGDVLYKSRVIGAMRKLSEIDNSCYILVQTPSGQKLIHAKKILIAVPQTIENLIPFDLDRTEREIFAQFTGTFWYSSMIRNIYHSAQSIQNNAYDSPYNLPILPGVYSLINTGVPDLNWVLYGSSTFMHTEDVKKDIVNSVLRIRHPNVTVTEPEIVAFRSHSPYELTVSVQAIRDGFYRKLDALQGHRGTYYTGAALTAHESHLIWGFTEKLLLKHFV